MEIIFLKDSLKVIHVILNLNVIGWSRVAHTFFNSIKLNSVYFVSPNITNYKSASEGLLVCLKNTGTLHLRESQFKLTGSSLNTFFWGGICHLR